jgi:hypothetical protein
MLKYGFFNSVNGDRLYDADDISNFFYKLISDGVFVTPSTSLQVTASSGMTVSVAAGYGMIKAKYINNDSPAYLTLDSADSTNPRLDRVVLGLNYANRAISLYIKKGTAAATPTAPTLTRTAGVLWELSLATIEVSAGATAITQADITDDRGNSELCGYVTGMIQQIDTSALFAQFTAAFYNWFNALTQSLTVDVSAQCETFTYTTTAANTVTIPIPIEGFNENTDSIAVYVSGLRITPEIDFTISGSMITLTKAISEIGTVVVVDIIKNGVQSPEIEPVSAMLVADSAGDSIIGDAQKEEE